MSEGSKRGESGCNEFKDAFKYYKSKHPPPLLDNVIDFRNNSNENKFILIAPGNINHAEPCASLGLQDTKCWRTYSVKDNAGLLYIPNPFTAKGQRYWVQRCLQDYPKKPNKTNIDSEIQIEDWWIFCKKNVQNKNKYLKKLRWTTLGYHHNWESKVYTEESYHRLPEDLADLCRLIAKSIGYDKFRPEAAIVNYYRMDSTLSPHTDHSEINLEAPLISISFGQSAIFLIGGREKSHKPAALRIHSGDIVIMSNESRLCYHAVPKILPALDTPWCIDDLQKIVKCAKKNSSDGVKSDGNNDDSVKWKKEFNSYITNSRININVRQVLNENQKTLTDK